MTHTHKILKRYINKSGTADHWSYDHGKVGQTDSRLSGSTFGFLLIMKFS